MIRHCIEESTDIVGRSESEAARLRPAVFGLLSLAMARPTMLQLSFADFELLRQGVRLEPVLQAICDFLDRQPGLVERVRRDLVRGLRHPNHGRLGSVRRRCCARWFRCA
jgi:hypothetical protein